MTCPAGKNCRYSHDLQHFDANWNPKRKTGGGSGRSTPREGKKSKSSKAGLRGIGGGGQNSFSGAGTEWTQCGYCGEEAWDPAWDQEWYPGWDQDWDPAWDQGWDPTWDQAWDQGWDPAWDQYDWGQELWDESSWEQEPWGQGQSQDQVSDQADEDDEEAPFDNPFRPMWIRSQKGSFRIKSAGSRRSKELGDSRDIPELVDSDTEPESSGEASSEPKIKGILKKNKKKTKIRRANGPVAC